MYLYLNIAGMQLLIKEKAAIDWSNVWAFVGETWAFWQTKFYSGVIGWTNIIGAFPIISSPALKYTLIWKLWLKQEWK